MKTLLSFFLSACLLVSSVTPSLAQVNVGRGVVQATKLSANSPKISRALDGFGKIVPRLSRYTRTTLWNTGRLMPAHAGTLINISPLSSELSLVSLTQLDLAAKRKEVFTTVMPQVIQKMEIPSLSEIIQMEEIFRGILEEGPRSATAKTLAEQGGALISLVMLSTNAKDVNCIRKFLEFNYGAFQEYADNYVIAACAMSGKEGEQILSELIAKRKASGQILLPVWNSVRVYYPELGLKENEISLIAPQFNKALEEAQLAQDSYSYFVQMLGDETALGNFVLLREGIQEKLGFAQTVSEVQSKLSIKQLQGTPSVGSREVPVLPQMEKSAEGRFALGAQQIPGGMPAQQATAGAVSEVPSSEIRSAFEQRVLKGDDKRAAIILEDNNPSGIQLRSILESRASSRFKKEALVRLYEKWAFSNTLNKLDPDTKARITQASSREIQAGLLYKLYELGLLNSDLKHVTDAPVSGTLLQELSDVVQQPGWNSKAKRAYASSEQLPFDNDPNRFVGVVPDVPEADVKKISDTFRSEGYVKVHSFAPTRTKKGLRYTSKIPFYYRNSFGQLSKEPIGLLSQNEAGWFGKFLSGIGLAEKPGLLIPEGFVLALNEQGKWEYAVPQGLFSLAERNPYSAKLLKKMLEKGRLPVLVDTPYSSTDLLAMSHLLERNPDLNLELKLNTPHSMKSFLTFHSLFIGNDAGAALTGPYKNALKDMPGLSNTMANGVSGVGYATPIPAGALVPFMSRVGDVATILGIYGLSGIGLLYSVFGLGMTGFVDPSTIPLGWLAVPTVALVLGASLANSYMPTFLNFYKDPVARTAANMDFSTKKQLSRLGLTGITALAGLFGGNWTIVAPIGLGLLASSSLLFFNTPMYREFVANRRRLKEEASNHSKQKVIQEPLTKEERIKQDEEAAEKSKKEAEQKKVFVDDYKKFRKKTPEMQSIKSRVKMVYAGYAASLLMINQTATQVLGAIGGQLLVVVCMLATWATRAFSTKKVKQNKITDDQFTGFSLPVLALSGLALTAMPYSAPLGIGAGIMALLHYMATATPGQLDAARMQNLVSAEMQHRKDAVSSDETLTQEQKKEKIKLLEKEEKVWSALASKDYSFYNARGLYGIGVATVGALLFADMGPQWTQDVLGWVSAHLDAPTPALALNRIIFAYSTAMATVLAWKNRGLSKDAFDLLFHKQKITDETIAQGKVNARSLGINEKNAEINLVKSQTAMKKLKSELIDYGYYSEQDMTDLLNRIVSINNRLVAQREILGSGKMTEPFENLGQIISTYGNILNKQDVSNMLRRRFNEIKEKFFKADGKTLQEQPVYIAEDSYSIPNEYAKYESASKLVKELDQMAYMIARNDAVDYELFVKYLSRVQEELLTYQKANPADSLRVSQLTQQMQEICKRLKTLDNQKGLLNPLQSDRASVKKAKQNLRDILSGF